MTIIRNSAKCNACGKEIVSTHVHDFVAHQCEQMKNRTDMDGNWFAVDGGRSYLRRVGHASLYTDTSITQP